MSVYSKNDSLFYLFLIEACFHLQFPLNFLNPETFDLFHCIRMLQGWIILYKLRTQKKVGILMTAFWSCNESFLHPIFQDLWELICDFLLHPHMWLRNISSRLVAFYFTAVNQANREKDEKSMETFFLVTPSRLFMIAVSLCCQLKAHLTDDAASNLITQNLVFAICGVHSFKGQKAHGDLHQFCGSIEQHEQEYFLKAFQLLDSRKGRSTFESLTSTCIPNQSDQRNNENLQHLLVSSLLKRMGKIALQMEDIQVCF